jgi:hypothetical protein
MAEISSMRDREEKIKRKNTFFVIFARFSGGWQGVSKDSNDVPNGCKR